MLKTENIGFWYENKENYLYKGVNLEFERGKMTAIIGSSGSGKTTFLSLIAGLENPKEGSIYWDDKKISKIGLTNYRRDDVSVVFQSYNLLPYMTAIQNVETAMAIAKVRRNHPKEYAQEALKSIGIEQDLANKKVTRLSGGQQQRVAIVRAMCCNHDLIVADEPTGNLDEETSKEIVRLFQKIAHEQNKCVIIVTHEQSVADSCDQVYELVKKKFVEKSKTE